MYKYTPLHVRKTTKIKEMFLSKSKYLHTIQRVTLSTKENSILL